MPIDEDTIRLSDGCFFTAEKWANVQESLFSIGSIIETYHGLTTSKPLQLRCFQSS